MSWQDRDYADDDRRKLGRPGGDWQGIRPTFDNPFTWAIDLFRLSGITVRVHILLILFMVIQLLRAAMQTGAGPAYVPIEFKLMAIAMGSLFVIILAHEFGHCLACRWVGGDAEEILMWPLGGLAYCRPPQRWKAHLITAIGGPAVNVVICIVAGGSLWLLVGRVWNIAIPNPLSLSGVFDVDVARSIAHQTLYLINYTSLVLLLFNLLPIFPLDGGRIAQALLWPRMGYSRSMLIAVRCGFIGAILLGVFGAVISELTLVGVALFGGITCYITQKQLQWTDSALGLESDEYALSVHSPEEPQNPRKPTWRQRRAQRQADSEQQEALEVDRILLKIAQSGMTSLTRNEKSLLKRVTERKRHTEN